MSGIESELNKIAKTLGKDKKGDKKDDKVPEEKVNAIYIRRNGLIQDDVTATKVGNTIHYAGSVWMIDQETENRSQFLKLVKFGIFKRIKPMPVYILVEGQPKVFTIGDIKHFVKTSDGKVFSADFLTENELGVLFANAMLLGKMQAQSRLEFIERLALLALIASGASAAIGIYVWFNVDKILQLLQQLVGKII